MKKIIKIISTIVAASIFFEAIALVTVKKMHESTVKKNASKYEDLINEYDKNIMEYAEYINSLNLSDLEIIMKVMNDMWGSYSYGESNNLIRGYYRLALFHERNGVCVSFADDFTAKINAINSEYDAKNITVYVKETNEDLKTVDIERTVLEIPKNQESDKKQQELGNHMVSVMEIDEYNLYLVVDPTKLLIGVLKDGNITILNSQDNDFMDYKFIPTLVSSEDRIISIYKNYFKTYFNATITEEEIENLYGLEAQEEALRNVSHIKKLVKD